MALVHPGKARGMSLSTSATPRIRKPMHPAVGLVAGFAVLTLVAMAVHMVFDLIFM